MSARPEETPDPEAPGFQRELTDRLTLLVDRNGDVVLAVRTPLPDEDGMNEWAFLRLPDPDAVMDALAAAKVAKAKLAKPRCHVEAWTDLFTSGDAHGFRFGWQCHAHGTGTHRAHYASADAAIAAGEELCPKQRPQPAPERVFTGGEQ